MWALGARCRAAVVHISSVVASLHQGIVAREPARGSRTKAARLGGQPTRAGASLVPEPRDRVSRSRNNVARYGGRGSWPTKPTQGVFGLPS
jgi:hypothetical protein